MKSKKKRKKKEKYMPKNGRWADPRKEKAYICSWNIYTIASFFSIWSFCILNVDKIQEYIFV